MSHLALLEKLEAILPAHAVKREEALCNHTTFCIGGPAEVLVLPQDYDQVKQVVALCKEERVPLHILGLGSDLLVSDSGVRGVVMKLADNLSGMSVEGSCICVQAGASNAQVAALAQEKGLAGFEFASGIPGTIGGAAIMNAGAYEGQFSDVARFVTCLTPEGDFVTLSADECDWGYRQSLMDKAGYVVLSVYLELTFDNPEAIQSRMDDLARRRADKQPLEMPSAGSTFKRPEGYYVGQLVQEADLRGFQVGGAAVSTKHAGFVVNQDNATAQDVCAVIAAVQEKIYSEKGVVLEPEVRMWGFDKESSRNDIQ